MKAAWDAFWSNRQRAYAVVVNVMGQLSALGAGVLTPSSTGSLLVWSFCIPMTIVLVLYLRRGQLDRYAIWGGAIGMLYVVVTAWAEGGIRSSTVFWLMVPPLVLHFLVSARWGLWMLLTSLLSLVGLASVDVMGWVFDPSVDVLNSPGLSAMSLMDYLAVSLVVFVIPWMYQQSIAERYGTIRERQLTLANKQKELEHTLQMRDRFIASVSHELRTPMNAILGLNQVLMDRVKDRPEALKVLKYTQQSADHLMTVINDVLDYSQFTTGELSAHQEQFRLREVIQAAYELFMPRTESMDLSYVCTIDDDVPHWVLSDRHRLMQVLVNLLGNAIKFTTHGSVKLTVAPSKSGVMFSVEDTGIGIAQDNLEKIFERYAQGDAQTQTRFGGTGLGLTISRKLVALLGGKLAVSSTVGQGSRFWFELPLTEHPLQSAPAPRPQAQAAHPTQALRFLVVDDQVVNRKLVKLILTQHCPDCFVAEAIHGEDALERLAKDPFDLVIMDMVMPGVDGIEATQRLRANPDQRLRNLPVLGLTANVTQSDLMRFGRAGVNEIMLKPLQVERFLQSVQRLLQRAQ